MPLSPPLEHWRKRRRDFAVDFIPVAATAATGFLKSAAPRLYPGRVLSA